MYDKTHHNIVISLQLIKKKKKKKIKKKKAPALLELGGISPPVTSFLIPLTSPPPAVLSPTESMARNEI